MPSGEVSLPETFEGPVQAGKERASRNAHKCQFPHYMVALSYGKVKCFQEGFALDTFNAVYVCFYVVHVRQCCIGLPRNCSVIRKCEWIEHGRMR